MITLLADRLWERRMKRHRTTRRLQRRATELKREAEGRMDEHELE
jgi:Flp pilus assembly protein TadD